MTAEEYRALLDTDFSDVKINEMPDMASYHADLNDTIEKRQQKFIRKVGNPYMMRVGKMKVKVSFANNGVSIEEAFKNMLLTVQNLFLESYGKTTFTEKEKVKCQFYKIYRELVMIVECSYRHYETEAQYNWVTSELKKDISKLQEMIYNYRTIVINEQKKISQ